MTISNIIIISAVTSFLVVAIEDLMAMSKQEKQMKELEAKYKHFYENYNLNPEENN